MYRPLMPKSIISTNGNETAVQPTNATLPSTVKPTTGRNIEGSEPNDNPTAKSSSTNPTAHPWPPSGEYPQPKPTTNTWPADSANDSTPYTTTARTKAKATLIYLEHGSATLRWFGYVESAEPLLLQVTAPILKPTAYP